MGILIALAGFAALVSIPHSGAPLVVDGAPSEAFWSEARAGSLRPRGFGAPFPEGGETRLIVRGDFLCLSARLPEPGRVVALSVGRNPEFWPEDLVVWRFRVLSGGRYKDFSLSVNALGGYRLEGARASGVLAAARVGSREWTVEVAIPLQLLSSLALVSVERVRALRPEAPELHWHWPEPNVPAEIQLTETRERTGAPRLELPPVGNSEPPISVRRVASVAALSDAWSDAAWQLSPALELRRDEASPRAPRHAANVRLAHDDATLSVLARLEGVDTADEFQVYLSPTGSSFAQFTITSAGVFRDARGNGPGIREPDPDAWDSAAQARVSRSGAEWTARLDIPLKPLARDLDHDSVSDAWRVLIRRIRRGEVATLPAIQTSTPRAPARYRRLLLGAEASTPAPAATAAIPHQVREEPDRTMVEKRLRERIVAAATSERRDWEKVRTRADWEQFRGKRLAALRASLGPFPARTPLRAKVVRRLDFGEGFTVEGIAFESRPHLVVTANLYLPEKISGRIPALLLVQNHQGSRAQPDLQDMAMSWARAGVAVLVMDQLGAGERIQSQPWPRESSYYSRYALANQLYLAGESLIQWMVWDLMRGVDLLLEKSYIDPSRIVMIGSVAGGGDPAAVAAALDDRIAAVAPFNFGEAGPEEHYLGNPRGYEHETAFPGWGSWESTRGLRGSIAGQFFPWFICASVAPRRFLYSFEMAWPKGVENQPPWPRYKKVFGFYGQPDNLDHIDGFGPFPGPGESNIGSYQRRRMHPILQRWLKFPVPAEEWHNPRTLSELSAFTPEIAAERQPKPVSELARIIAAGRLKKARAGGSLRDALRARLGDIEPLPNPTATAAWTRNVGDLRVEAYEIQTEPGIQAPFLLLKPASPAKPPVVLALAQGGKERFVLDRWPQIESLTRAGIAVCLADVRAVGETARDPVMRGPGAMSWAATELMLGNTLIGAQLKDARTILQHLSGRADLDGQRIALWGDSFSPANPDRLLVDESPNMPAGPQIQHQVEPLGPLLALLTALYEDRVRAVVTRGGLVSFLSALDDRFCYLPQDVVVPGFLEAGDIPDIEKALVQRPLLQVDRVDGRNRRSGPAPAAPDAVPAWLTEQMRRM